MTMEHEQIGAVLKRIADATGRIDAAAARLRGQVASTAASGGAAPTRDAVAAALAELDALLEQLER